MTLRFRYVDSLEGINPEQFPGDIFILPNGDAYQANAGDQLGGFWSKLLGIAAPFAAAIPGAGLLIAPALSAASGALAAHEANKNAESNQVISDTVAQIDQVITNLANRQITTSEAIKTRDSIYQTWDKYKMSQPKVDDRNYLYETGDLKYISPRWDILNAKIDEIAKLEAQEQTAKTTGGADTSTLPFGLSFTELAFAGLAAYFIFGRS